MEKEKMNIIELQYDEVDQNYTDFIQFIDRSFDALYFLIEAAGLYNLLNDTNISENEFLYCLDETEKERILNEMVNDDVDLKQYYDNLDEIISAEIETVVPYVISNVKSLNELLNKYGIKTGTVGYSPWAYYIADGNENVEFISDFYENNNFYNISVLDSAGEVIDSLGWLYIANSDDLCNEISEQFNIDDFYLVDNDASKYFKHKKVDKIVNCTYSFKIKED